MIFTSLGRRILLALAAALLVSPAWGQGTAKPGTLMIGFIPAEDSRAMVRSTSSPSTPA